MPDGKVDSGSPLARWRIEGNLDSSAQCEFLRDTLRRATVLARRAEDPPMEVEIEADHQAVCIATDDSRLIAARRRELKESSK